MRPYLLALSAILFPAALIAPPAGPGPAPALIQSPALDKALPGYRPGKPVDCILLSRSQGSSTLLNPDTIIYRVTSKLSYVNQPVRGCGFRSDPIIVSRTPSNRLCRGDIITAVDRASRFPMGSCGLGVFVPYTRTR